MLDWQVRRNRVGRSSVKLAQNLARKGGGGQWRGTRTGKTCNKIESAMEFCVGQ